MFKNRRYRVSYAFAVATHVLPYQRVDDDECHRSKCGPRGNSQLIKI